MNKRALTVLASLLCAPAASFADALPDYIRFAEDRHSARLETAIRTFVLPSGQEVDLIGVVHIADAAYYQDLNQRFAAYDSVLFEMVGDPHGLASGRRGPQGGGGVSSIQLAASQHLDLTFQLGAIDYTAKNMVHADTTAEEFARMEQERGENVLTFFVSAMQAQMQTQMGSAKGRAAMSELDTFALIRILMSPDSATAFKKALARNFDQMEAMTAAMEGSRGTAVLSGRNEVLMRKLKEVLAGKRQRRIAVFYGGAHMPGIETSLLKDMNAKTSGEHWLAAWTMPKP